MQVKRLIITTGLLMSAVLATMADQPASVWTLQQCIEHAKENNVSLKKSRVQVNSGVVDIKAAKAALFPSLTASVGQHVANKPYGDTNYNGSYGIDANWTLYSGGKLTNTVKQQSINNEIEKLAVQESENTLEEQVTTLYMQTLYAMEAVKMNETNLTLSESTLKRANELFKAGTLARTDIAKLEAQVSADQYQLVSSKAALADYETQLKQLMEIDAEETISLASPTEMDAEGNNILPAKNEVFQAAVALRPEISSGKKSVDAAELGIKIAKGGYLPTVSATAGIGTGNYNGMNMSFAQQLKSNWNNTVGLTLSVPIFDNRKTKSAVQKAQYQKETMELELKDRYKTLYKTIETLWQNANNAQAQYAAAQKKRSSMLTSFELATEQFNLGMVNTLDLLTEKSNWLNAEQELLQTKYMAILNRKLLLFYQGETNL